MGAYGVDNFGYTLFLEQRIEVEVRVVGAEEK
jgi:hypothetical protein